MSFSARRRLVESESFGGDPVLAVAADGRALLATTTSDGLIVLERAPGEDFIRRPAIQADSSATVALALGAHGAAVIAWRDGGPGGAVSAMMRDGVVPF